MSSHLHDWLPLPRAAREEWLNEARSIALADPGLVTQAPPGTRFELPGRIITDLTAFLCAVGEAVNGPHGYFGRSLNSFQDCLDGGFGASRPSTLVWKDAETSRAALGHAAMQEWANEQLEAQAFVDDQGRSWLQALADTADRGEGTTLFEAIAGIIVSAGWQLELCDARGEVVQTLP